MAGTQILYFDDILARRLRPDILTSEEALEQAKALARAERERIDKLDVLGRTFELLPLNNEAKRDPNSNRDNDGRPSKRLVDVVGDDEGPQMPRSLTPAAKAPAPSCVLTKPLVRRVCRFQFASFCPLIIAGQRANPFPISVRRLWPHIGAPKARLSIALYGR
jgi:hypothetical protein